MITLEQIKTGDAHPSPFVEKRTAELLNAIVQLNYMLQGIVRLEDHAELSEGPIRDALLAGWEATYRRMLELISDIDAAMDCIRELGADNLRESLRKAFAAGKFDDIVAGAKK